MQQDKKNIKTIFNCRELCHSIYKLILQTITKQCGFIWIEIYKIYILFSSIKSYIKVW